MSPRFKAFAFVVCSSIYAGNAAADELPYDRLSSCDPEVVRRTADQILKDSSTLQYPQGLLLAAMGERARGRKERATFFYLAGWLRSSRQVIVTWPHEAELLKIIIDAATETMMPALEADPGLVSKVLPRVVDWDRSNQDPYGDLTKLSKDERTKLAELDASFLRLPDQIRKAAQAKTGVQEAEAAKEQQIREEIAKACGPTAVSGT